MRLRVQPALTRAFIRAVIVFTGETDAAEVILRSGDFRIEGGADGFALLFQAGEGGKQGRSDPFPNRQGDRFRT